MQEGRIGLWLYRSSKGNIEWKGRGDLEEQDKKMAVLIDAENISYRYAKIILDEASNYGPLIYKRIYGDWSSPTMAPWRNLILNYSIQPIQQFANTRGKNATDSALIIDAMDLLHAGKLQGFCIVSSDSDFTRLAARLRESEMLVVGMGEKKTPASFISACDRFHYLDVLLSERIRSSNAQKTPATGFGEQANAVAADDSDVKSGRDKAEVAKAISDLVAEHSDEAGWYFLGELGSRLQSRYPDFDSRNFGYAKLSDFVRSLGAYEFRSNVNPYNKNLQLVYIRKKED